MRRAPLDNRKIAFGCGRQAIRRLCARPLSWRARSSSRWHVCGLGSAAVVAPPPRTAFVPVRGIHPRMRLAWLGRNTSRHPARPPRGACRTRAADSLWPRSSLASPHPLKAPASSRGARLSAARLMAGLCVRNSRTRHHAPGTRRKAFREAREAGAFVCGEGRVSCPAERIARGRAAEVLRGPTKSRRCARTTPRNRRKAVIRNAGFRGRA